MSSWQSIIHFLPGQERTKRVRIGLGLTLLFGLFFDLLPLILNGGTLAYPLEGGGLYYYFSKTILVQDFAYPTHIPYYTPGGIPFGYPPLDFYTIAAIAAFTPLSVLTLHTYLPFLVSIATLPAFYYFATGFFDETEHSVFATLVFVLLLGSYFLPGHRLMDGVGTLLFLIGAGALMRLFAERKVRQLLVAGGMFALGILSGPHGAYSFGLFFVLVAVFKRRDRSALRLLASVLVLGILGSLPWLLAVIPRNGLGVILTGFTSQHYTGTLPFTLGEALTFEPFETVFWPVIMLMGVFRNAARREWFLPAWLGVSTFAGEINYIRFIPAAFLITFGLFDVLVPGLRRLPEFTTVNGRRLLPLLFVALVVLQGAGYAAGTTYLVSRHTADPSVVTAIETAGERTPSDSTFLIVNSESMWRTDEWFPAIAHREAVVRHGAEWDGEWGEIYQLERDLRSATTVSDIQSMAKRHDVHFTHLFVVKDDSSQALIENAKSSPCTETVFENEGAIVVHVEPACG